MRMRMNILRPLSPHLPIYKPQLTSTFPISHRISGAFLATLVLFFYLLCLKMGLICFTYSNFYRFFFYSSKLILISAEITALALSYHLYNGVRHLLTDFSYPKSGSRICCLFQRALPFIPLFLHCLRTLLFYSDSDFVFFGGFKTFFDNDNRTPSTSSEWFTYTSDFDDDSASSGRSGSLPSVNQPMPSVEGAGPSNVAPASVGTSAGPAPENNNNPDVIAALALRSEIRALIEERFRVESDKVLRAPLSRLFPHWMTPYHQDAAHQLLVELELDDELNPAILQEFLSRFQSDRNFLKAEIRQWVRQRWGN